MARYYRGFRLTSDTFNIVKSVIVRDAETLVAHPFLGPAGTDKVQHNGQSQIEYTFPTPFVANLCRYEPTTNTIPWKVFGEVEWITDPWPDLTEEFSPWTNLGDNRAKYMLGIIIPEDTNGVSVTIRMVSSDGGFVDLTTTTVATEKTPRAYAFTVPLIGHEFQFQPQQPVRAWYPEITPLMEIWPEFTAEATPWMNLGTTATKYMRGATIPLDTGGVPVVIKLVSSDGSSVNLIATTALSVKTPVPFAFSVPLIGHEFQLIPQGPCRIFVDDIKWIYEEWPELTLESSPWMDLKTQGAKYMRGAVLPMDTGGVPVTLTFVSSDGGSTVVGPFTTVADEKTAQPMSLPIPLVGHDFQIRKSAHCRIWWDEIRWDFDPWPELITEATGWLPILGGQNAFLQGLVLPIEALGAVPNLEVLTDRGHTIPLIVTVTPAANVKTSVPFSLATPIVAHQIQLVPLSPCRVWLGEINWVAQPTPELAANWITQFTAHGISGYQHIPRIEVAYAAIKPVTLTLTAFDGTSPQPVILPATGGVYQKRLLTLTANKFMLVSYAAVSAAPFQLFLNDWIVWLGQWGRSGPYLQYHNMGAEYGDKVTI